MHTQVQQELTDTCKQLHDMEQDVQQAARAKAELLDTDANKTAKVQELGQQLQAKEVATFVSWRRWW